MPVYIIFLDDDDHMTAWRLLGGQVALVALRTMMADGSGGPDEHG